MRPHSKFSALLSAYDRTKSSLHESHASIQRMQHKIQAFLCHAIRFVFERTCECIRIAFIRSLCIYFSWCHVFPVSVGVWEKDTERETEEKSFFFFSQMSGWMALHVSMRNAMCIFRSAWGKNMQLHNFDLLLYLKYKSVYAIQWCFPIRQLFCWFLGSLSFSFTLFHFLPPSSILSCTLALSFYILFLASQ